ncbi:uncharacterized protein [Venturia canescens]|uniref:uncharacterized protein n=1 Tax=Venturia canescens TaxID=32260 RepID=UPI001C9BE4C7|nr:uncharacterized protein LOC122418345 [Venturia canescens]
MRVEHIEHRIESQMETLDLLQDTRQTLLREGSTITSYRLDTRSAALKQLWDKFSTTHEAIGIAITQLRTEEKEKLHRHIYFKDKLYKSAYEIHLEAAEIINELSDGDKNLHRSSSTASLTQSLSQQPIWQRGPRLPRIDLPKFNGTPSEWLPFKDLFNSLVISNQTLSSVEKLQYLKTSLTGSAEALLKNTTLTTDNFQKAWEALEVFYENKRLLVNSAFHSLLTLKRMTKESGSEMEYLYTNIMQIFRTLETLGRPVNYWDDFLVFIATQRLDAESVKAWEHHLGPSRDPPTWKNFSDFLMKRMLSLKAFEKSRQGKPQLAQHHQIVKTYYASENQEQHNKKKTCPFCSEDHYAATCIQFCNKTTEQKTSLIIKHKLCFNCLGFHQISACRSLKRCAKCGRKHHTSIHTEKFSKSNNENYSSASTHIQGNHASLTQQPSTSCTLLATAQVYVSTETEEKIQARVLIDPGSQISFISENFVQCHHISRSKSSLVIHGIGAVKAGKTKGKTSIVLSPYFASKEQCKLTAHILPKLISTLPTIKLDNLQNLPHLHGLTLADPHYYLPGSIDILIGSDYYGQIIEEGLKKENNNLPIAQKTIFGWVLSGPPTITQPQTNVHGFTVTIDQDLHDLLQRFWHLEEIPSSNRSKRSTENQQCEEHFIQTHTRDENGRYVVKLPLKSSASNLGESKSYACKILFSLEKRFKNDPALYKSYCEFLKEYESMGHMILVPESTTDSKCVYYLPHHGVIRTNSLTTKLRVVFNGSSRTSNGISLNNIVYTGEKLQIDLHDVLLWFRQFRYVFSSDMEKMYRQIRVHHDDWGLQRILWKDEFGKIITFELTTVTYGLACAPFLALRCLLQLVHDEGQKYPLAIPPLTQGRYVDDVFGGADSIHEAQAIVKQTNEMCMAGGFALRKWISNHQEILKNIPPNICINPPSVAIDEETTVHALGYMAFVMLLNKLSLLLFIFDPLLMTQLKQQLSAQKQKLLL